MPTSSRNEAALAAIRAAASSRVGPAGTLKKSADGYVYVEEEPAALAEAAGLSLDVYAAASMIASEKGSGSAEELLALGEALRNYCRLVGQAPAALLTRATRSAESAGHFGEQAAGRWASSRLRPSARHAEAARWSLEQGTALALGASDFFDPRTADGGSQLGHATVPAEKYLRDKAAEGYQWVGPIVGVDPRSLMLLARVRTAVDPAEAIAVARGASARGLLDNLFTLLADVLSAVGIA